MNKKRQLVIEKLANTVRGVLEVSKLYNLVSLVVAVGVVVYLRLRKLGMYYGRLGTNL